MKPEMKPEIKQGIETKVFMNGNSQAVRIPKKLKLKTTSVVIRQNNNGDLIISTSAHERQKQCKKLFSIIDENKDQLIDFMNDRNDEPPRTRIFE